MVSALDSGLSGPRSSPGWGQCVVFLGKTLLSIQVYFRNGYLEIVFNLYNLLQSIILLSVSFGRKLLEVIFHPLRLILDI